jgi:hypothetical protein
VREKQGGDGVQFVVLVGFPWLAWSRHMLMVRKNTILDSINQHALSKQEELCTGLPVVRLISSNRPKWVSLMADSNMAPIQPTKTASRSRLHRDRHTAIVENSEEWCIIALFVSTPNEHQAVSPVRSQGYAD